MLRKTPKNLHITKRDFLQRNCFQSRSPKGPLRRDFLDIHLTKFFGVRKFKDTSAMRVIYFLKMLKIESKFPNCKKNSEKIFCFWDNCIWKCCNKLSLLRRENLSSAVNVLRNSPKIFISLTETFSNWISWRVINKSAKSAAVKFSAVFRLVYHVTSGILLWNWTF